MADLDKLHETYKAARLKYLSVRRDAEEALIAEIVDRLRDTEYRLRIAGERIIDLEMRLAQRGSLTDMPATDRMATARAAKAAKREAGAPEPA
jgi:hypothetical protein